MFGSGLVRDQNFGIGILNLAWNGPFWQSRSYISKRVKANNKMDLPANGYSSRRRKMITMKLSTTILWWFRNLLIILVSKLLLLTRSKYGHILAPACTWTINYNHGKLFQSHFHTFWLLSTLILRFNKFLFKISTISQPCPD